MENSTPQWLKDVQNNSWSPEILISGLTITFLFVINNPIHNFFAMLLQDFGAGLYASLSFLFFIISLNVIKTVLILHLLLRGLWTGLIGLSYVYPDGVKNEKLPSVMRSIVFKKPVELVLDVEKLCSLLFSFIFVFIFFLLLVIILYTPAMIIEIIFPGKSLIYVGIYFIVIMIPLFIVALSKKGKFKQKVQSNIFNNLYYTVSTNAGNMLTLILLVLSIIISIPISYSQIDNFKYDNLSSDNYSEVAIYLKQNENYNDERNNKVRVDKATIDSYFVKDDINLFISYYKEDFNDFYMAKKNSELFVKLKNIENVNINELCVIYNIYIDSIPVTNIQWISARHQQTDQKGSTAVIDVKDISPGIHKLTIDKIVWSIKKEEFRLIKPWDDIVFYKK